MCQGKLIILFIDHLEELQGSWRNKAITLLYILNLRQSGQDTVEELRSKDFRKDLEDRERQAARDRTKEKGSRSTADPPKRPRLDQPPPSNLDADDPVDDDDDDDSDERFLYNFLSALGLSFC